MIAFKIVEWERCVWFQSSDWIGSSRKCRQWGTLMTRRSPASRRTTSILDGARTRTTAGVIPTSAVSAVCRSICGSVAVGRGLSGPPTSRLRGDEVHHRHALFVCFTAPQRPGRVGPDRHLPGVARDLLFYPPYITDINHCSEEASISVGGITLNKKYWVSFCPPEKIDKRRQKGTQVYKFTS